MAFNNDYRKELNIKAAPKQVFDAVTRHIDKWWSENFEGSALSEGDEFMVKFGATFKLIRISSVEPDRKVSWLCIDQHMEMPPGILPLKNPSEWVGNTITWEVEADGAGSKLKHTHFGLTPEVDCWLVCETGWDQSLKSLVAFLETGKGMPFEQLDEEHLNRALEYQRKRLANN